jgi:hypothetical protein
MRWTWLQVGLKSGDQKPLGIVGQDRSRDAATSCPAWTAVPRWLTSRRSQLGRLAAIWYLDGTLNHGATNPTLGAHHGPRAYS